jgi:hypothetical protein
MGATNTAVELTPEEIAFANELQAVVDEWPMERQELFLKVLEEEFPDAQPHVTAA